jgi:hypothetical protein
MDSHDAVVTITKTNKNLTNFSTEPDLHAFPASVFSEVNFHKKDDQLFVQIAMNDIDLTNIKLSASGKSLIIRIQREEENNFIRIISLPFQVISNRVKPNTPAISSRSGFPSFPLAERLISNKNKTFFFRKKGEQPSNIVSDES